MGWENGGPDAKGEVGTQSPATQLTPTFSRDELGAGLVQMLGDKGGDFKTSLDTWRRHLSSWLQKASTGGYVANVVRDVILGAVERRFANMLGIELCTTAVRNLAGASGHYNESQPAARL